jgi:hypothetical protein
VAFFAFPKNSVEHSGCTEQADMAAVTRRERSAAHTTLLAEQYPAGLAVSGRSKQKVFHFIERNTGVRQNYGLRTGHLISAIGFIGQHLEIVRGC